MLSTTGLFIGFLSLISRFVVADNAIRLGCFNVTDSGLTESKTRRSRDSGHGFEWCVTHCQERNYTFAGIQRSRTCVCGDVLGGARLVPLHECITPCHDGMCGTGNRLIVYILAIGDALTEIAHPTSSVDLSPVNFRQFLIVGGSFMAAVVMLSLLIHCVRVSRRRDRLLKLYISHLEQGERGARRPPGTLTISNTLCAEFCCCCSSAREDDDLDYEELLTQLDIHPDHRTSFSHKVKEYVKRCESEKNMERGEVERVLRSLAKTGSLANTRSSLRKLADQYARSKRQKKHSVGISHKNLTIPVHGTTSSPAKLCRKMKGSSLSSIEKAFPDYNSSISMYMNSNLFNNGTNGRSVPNDASTFGGILEEDGAAIQCSSSQCSSNRLLPAAASNITRSPHRSRDRSLARLSRHKHHVQSESPSRHRRSRTRNGDSHSETSDSASGSDTDS